MKVHVVMSNDYPNAVFRSQDEAEAYCAVMRREGPHGARVHWRSYVFELQGRRKHLGWWPVSWLRAFVQWRLRGAVARGDIRLASQLRSAVASLDKTMGD